MATWRDVQNLIVSIAQGALTNAGVTATIGVGYPPVRALQNVARSGLLISVYDHGIAPDKTRWMPFPALDAVAIASDIGVTAPSTINAASSGSILVSGSPIAGDSLSINVYHGGPSQGATYTLAQSGTLDDLCNGFVNAVNTDATTIYNTSGTVQSGGMQGIVATYLGSGDIEIQNNRPSAIGLIVTAVNGFNNVTEIRRVMRQVQITSWANSPDLRDTVCDPIELAFSEQQVYFGSQFPDGTWARILLENDVSVEEDTLQDVFRRDFIIGCEYGIVQPSVTYPVTVTQLLQQEL